MNSMGNKIRSAFDPSAGKWRIDWPGRVSRHDLVYLTPPLDPMQGMPIGNGDVGGKLICRSEERVIALDTSVGERILLAPDEESFLTWQTVPETPNQNEAPKTDSTGGASLGLPRMF